MSVDLLNTDEVKELIREFESKENKARKFHSWKNHRIHYGEQSLFVKEELKKLFPLTHEMFRISDTSLVKKVVDKIGKSYKEPPLRNLDKDGKGNEDETSVYSEILKESKANKAMQRLDEYVCRDRYAVLWVSYIEEKFRLLPLAGFNFDVKLDPATGEMVLFVLSFYKGTAQDKDYVKEFAMWTDKHHVTYEANISAIGEVSKITKKENEENPSDDNPIGMIPAIYVSQDIDAEIPVNTPLPDQSTQLNVMLSELMTAASKQGHGQLVRKVIEGQETKEVAVGMHTLIDLTLSNNIDEPQPDVYYINANPDLSGQRETVAAYLRSILDENGISGGDILSGDTKDFASGLDRALAMADVSDQIEDNQTLYVDVENGLFDIIKGYNNMGNAKKFNSESVSVAFMKPKVLMSDKETLENIEKRLSLGLIEEWEKFKIIDPNLSEDDCKAKLEAIKEEKAENAPPIVGDVEPEIEKDEM